MAGELAVTITEREFEYLDGPKGASHRARCSGAVQSAFGGGLRATVDKVVEKARWLHRY
jgi:hypothetical protein